MWKALALKELRENIGFAAIGLVVYLFVASAAMRMNLMPVPQVNLLAVENDNIPFIDTFTFQFGIASLLLTTALGIRQAWAESTNSLYLFLLHRPVSPRFVANVKLVVGIGLYFVCGAVPILVFAWWASTPGTHASPFFWSMTWSSWITWAAMTLVYLGAFLTGIRPGRWVGTRFAPLVATTLFVLVLNLIPSWPVRLMLIVALGALLYLNILYIFRTRDFS